MEPKRWKRFLCACFVLVATGAFADDEEEKLPREGIAKIDDGADAAKDWMSQFGLTLGMGISFSFQYSFNDPAGGFLGLRLIDKDHDEFSLDLYQITLRRDATDPGAFGFLVQPAFGRLAKRFKSDWDGSGVFNDTEWEDNEVEIQQSFVTYNAPLGGGLLLKLGKFNTLVGSEVNEPWNNLTYSRQYLYSLAQPSGHTGGLATYTVSDTLNFTLGGITGWDVVEDNNGRPSFIGQIGLLPAAEYNFFLTTIIGPEIPKNDGDLRSLFDLVAILKPIENLSLVTNVDYGVQDSSKIDGSGDDAIFWGISEAFNYAFTPRLDATYRVEWFEDAGGARTGARQRIWDMTFAARYKVTDYLYVRTEYRHDESDGRPFPSSDALLVKGQDSVATDFGYVF